MHRLHKFRYLNIIIFDIRFYKIQFDFASIQDDWTLSPKHYLKWGPIMGTGLGDIDGKGNSREVGVPISRLIGDQAPKQVGLGYAHMPFGYPIRLGVIW